MSAPGAANTADASKVSRWTASSALLHQQRLRGLMHTHAAVMQSGLHVSGLHQYDSQHVLIRVAQRSVYISTGCPAMQ